MTEPRAEPFADPDMGSDAAHERLLMALKASRCGTWRWDVGTDVVEWDETLSRVYGLPHERAPKTSREFLALVHDDDRAFVQETLARCLAGRDDVDYEFRVVVDGEMKWIYDRSSLMRGADGAPLYMTGVCLDMTARKRVEQEKASALEQQKLLLQELNHRVKNHLQIIIGMLQLKAARQENASAKADFQTAIQRIHTIADLHMRLYRDDHFGAVEMGSYIDGLCDNLRRSIITDARVRLDCEIEPALLSVDQAMPLGLIVNELVTNAVKYAFAPGAQGRIRVRIQQRGERMTLSVKDNGRGLPEGVRGARRVGIGTRLVTGLVRQLGGRLRVTTRNGTGFHLSFNPQGRAEAVKA